MHRAHSDAMHDRRPIRDRGRGASSRPIRDSPTTDPSSMPDPTRDPIPMTMSSKDPNTMNSSPSSS